MPEHHQVVIIGAGQNGLALGYHLNQRGIPYLILERAERPGTPWRNERWDSFTLITPNAITELPGLPSPGADEPNGFLDRVTWLDYFDRYSAFVNPPLRTGIEVSAVRTDEGRFRIETSTGPIVADQVVVASGSTLIPIVPALAAGLAPGLNQLHTQRYRNPDALPPGGVLVVGTGQSGSQIVEELYQSGRHVVQAVGNTPRLPRRYRGTDVTLWMRQPGFPSFSRPRPASVAHYTGRDGGRSLNLHRFAKDGVTLIGRISGIDGTRLSIQPDLHDSLAASDAEYHRFLASAERYAAERGWTLPPDVPDPNADLRDGYDQPLRTTLDLEAEGITTVIWATGFRHGYGIIDAPIFDETGYPIIDRGTTTIPGLYVAGGARGVHSSTLIAGVPGESAFLAETIAARQAGN